MHQLVGFGALGLFGFFRRNPLGFDAGGFLGDLALLLGADRGRPRFRLRRFAGVALVGKPLALFLPLGEVRVVARVGFLRACLKRLTRLLLVRETIVETFFLEAAHAETEDPLGGEARNLCQNARFSTPEMP